MKNFCSITLGRVISTARWKQGLSQRELVAEISRTTRVNEDWALLALGKLECDRLDIQKSSDYDWLIFRLGQVLDIDEDYLESIRKQTEVATIDPSGGIFPIYFKS